MATKKATTEAGKSGNHAPSTGCVQIALNIIEEEREQLRALAIVLEGALGKMCNDGGDPPDEVPAPLTEWRLAQVLMSVLESNLMGDVKPLLGVVEEASHG